MDSLVKGVMAMVRLDVEDRKISNLSLRVAAMNVQELLGFSDDTTHPIRHCCDGLAALTNKKYNIKVEIPKASSCCQFSPWRAVCSS